MVTPSFISKHHPDIRFFLTILGVIVIDQITKMLVKNTLAPLDSADIIPKILSFTYITNTGAVFGALRGMNTLLIAVSIIVIASLLYYYHKKRDEEKIPRTSFALIVGGALSNLIDRIALGFVVDFIDVHFWPAFNIADSAITLGVAALVIFYLRKENP